jgi:hypothetical protein
MSISGRYMQMVLRDRHDSSANVTSEVIRHMHLECLLQLWALREALGGMIFQCEVQE